MMIPFSLLPAFLFLFAVLLFAVVNPTRRTLRTGMLVGLQQVLVPLTCTPVAANPSLLGLSLDGCTVGAATIVCAEEEDEDPL